MCFLWKEDCITCITVSQADQKEKRGERGEELRVKFNKVISLPLEMS